MAREIKVSPLGDTRSLERAFERASSSGGKFHSSLGHVGSGLATMGKAAGIAGVAVVGLAAVVGGKLVQDMAKQQAVSNQTNAAIASTGRVAGVTRKHVEDLATAIQNKSGIDDQTVQSGENMLLTFTNIRNEAGRGNKIFDQSTKVLLDMSTALGQDVPKSAIQLGKALNDPIKGVSALQRVGVTFTGQQKDQIKALVESGHAMDAQKLILRELNKEFGGSAQAAGQSLPGQLNILKGRLMDLGTTLLQAALPALNKLTRAAVELVTAIQQHMPQIKAAWAQYGAPVFAAIVVAGQRVVSWVRENWPQIKATIKAVIDWIGTNILPTVRAVVNDMIALWNKFGDKIIGVLKPLLQELRAVIEGVLAVIRGDWGKAWESVKAIFVNAWNAIKGVFSLNVAVFKALGAKLGGAIIDGISALPGMLAGVATRALGALTDKLLSFHVSIKTQSYLGVPFPVGMSVGFAGGGGSSSGATFSLPKVNLTGAGPTGGLAPQTGANAGVGKSFLAGNLPHVTGSASPAANFTPLGGGSGGGSAGGTGGGGGSASAALDKIKAKLQAVADATAKVRDIIVGKMNDAFQKVGDFALKAFDGATGAGLQRLQDKAAKASSLIQANLAAALNTISATQGALTPAEKALADLQAGHEQAARDMDSSSAAAQLQAAMVGGDPSEIAAAQKAVDDAAYNQRVFDLGVKAAAERKIADQQATDDAAAAQKKAADDQKVVDAKLAKDTLNYQSARDLQRIALENQLQDFKDSLDKHPKAWKAVHAKVIKLFSDDFGPDFKTAGVNIGNAYIKGLASAFAAVGGIAPGAQKGVDTAAAAAGRIPKLASGGIVTSPTYALIGEAGPEAVVPLGAIGGGGGHTFNFYGWVADKDDVVEAVRNALIRTGRNTTGGAFGRFA